MRRSEDCRLRAQGTRWPGCCPSSPLGPSPRWECPASPSSLTWARSPGWLRPWPRCRHHLEECRGCPCPASRPRPAWPRLGLGWVCPVSPSRERSCPASTSLPPRLFPRSSVSSSLSPSLATSRPRPSLHSPARSWPSDPSPSDPSRRAPPALTRRRGWRPRPSSLLWNERSLP